MATGSKRRYVRSRQVDPEPIESPDATFVRQRFIPRVRREWVEACDRIMIDHGSVEGSTIYSNRNNARWHAQNLMRLMVELRIHQRSELREHVERAGDGFVWSVEYLGRDGRNADHAR